MVQTINGGLGGALLREHIEKLAKKGAKKVGEKTEKKTGVDVQALVKAGNVEALKALAKQNPAIAKIPEVAKLLKSQGQ